mgnify:CR=1 FL=1
METALSGAQMNIGSHDSVLTCLQKTQKITAINVGPHQADWPENGKPVIK